MRMYFKFIRAERCVPLSSDKYKQVPKKFDSVMMLLMLLTLSFCDEMRNYTFFSCRVYSPLIIVSIDVYTVQIAYI